MANRLFNTLFSITFVIIIYFLTYVMYLLFYPFKTIDVLNDPMPVLTPVVKSGESVTYMVDYCRFVGGPGRIYRTITGPSNVPIPPVDSVTKVGCRKTKVSVIVPKGIPVGKYTIHIVHEFQVNPLRKVTGVQDTQEFTVIEGDK